MTLQLVEVTQDKEFDVLIQLLWVSYANPRIPFLPLLFSAKNDTDEEQKRMIQICKTMMVQGHRSDKSSHWIQVIDSANAEVIAGARWHIHETDPYSNTPHPDFEAPFWPEGDRKTYASVNIGAIVNPRRERYRKPHLNLQICFVHPDHRRRGAGRLLMQWGIDKADELDLDAFVEATQLGKKLYEKYGFVVVSKDEVDTQRQNPSPEWRDMEARFPPIPWYCMWRPKQGKMLPGTLLPW